MTTMLLPLRSMLDAVKVVFPETYFVPEVRLPSGSSVLLAAL